MTPFRLILRNLLFHWRGNFAVLLGVVVGSIVLTGALFVGDSLQRSLRDLTLRRLDWVDETLIAPRFFREGLAEELTGTQSAEKLCPAIVLQATAAKKEADDDEGLGRAVRRVTVLGVDRRFFAAEETPASFSGVWLNSTLANELKVKAGERIGLRMQKPADVPRESLLGQRKSADVVDEVTLVVDKVLTPDDPLDPFSLRPSLDAPRTAFVPLNVLQSKLGLKDRINAIFVGEPTPALADDLKNHLKLEDWGLVLHDPKERVDAIFAKLDKDGHDRLTPEEWRGALPKSLIQSIQPKAPNTPTRAEMLDFYRKQRNYLSLESNQLMLEEPLAKVALTAAMDNDLRAAPTLVYLANTIGKVSYSTCAATGVGGLSWGIPYSIVAALPLGQREPLGPFLPREVEKLADDEIILADWKDSPLQAKVGDEIFLTYFEPELQSAPRESMARFRLAGFIPLEGAAADPDLTPALRGITDQRSIASWKPPFPGFDKSRIRSGDANEKFWEDYRTTPKAYITLAAGQRLWGSRFGNLTSIRLALDTDKNPAKRTEAFKKSLEANLKPKDGGFVFQKVKEDALRASTGGGFDFSQLFLGFSAFLIVAALLLVGLLARLNLERRASEIGLLLALGIRRSQVLLLLLIEGALVAAVGTAVGCGLAIFYTGLVIRYMDTVWPGGGLGSFLQPHIGKRSLAIGLVASLSVSLITVAGSVLFFGRVPPTMLLAGRTTVEGLDVSGRPRWSLLVMGLSALGAAILLACSKLVSDHEMQAMIFFTSGSLLLTACLAAVWAWMHQTKQRTVAGRGWWGVGRLGVRNAARNPLRSLLTCGLLASAAFVVVAVESFRQKPDADETKPDSPSGGFALLAETDLPLFQDLNSSGGREDLLEQVETKLYGKQPFVQREEERAEARRVLEQTHIYAFRVRSGDDASCLNLYQPRRPRLLGVPPSLIERGGFRFASTDADADEEGNPWTILRRDVKSVVPAFGEKNTVEWMLHKEQGQVYPVTDEHGVSQHMRIDGLLQNSVFQSGLLVSEERFLGLYPSHEGYNFFLIETPPEHVERVKELLEVGLADRGVEVTRSSERLASYLAVENTYISTFQALGGLGLMLGSLGLAVVLLRGVWERRGELALLRALGFRRMTLGWLVLAENGFLLFLGLAAGALSALVAVAPHLWGGSGSLPWEQLVGLFGVVLVVGLAAGTVAVIGTLRAPLIPALRRE